MKGDKCHLHPMRFEHVYMTDEELDEQLGEFVKTAKRELSRANEALARVEAEYLEEGACGLADLMTILDSVKFEATRLYVESERQLHLAPKKKKRT